MAGTFLEMVAVRGPLMRGSLGGRGSLSHRPGHFDRVPRTPDNWGLVEAKEVTEDELLRSAPGTSARQLKRWRMEGLMPRPIQRHVAGRRGSVSSYPPQAVGQLASLLRLRSQERRLDELRFRLWWQGYWVEEAALRATLVGLAEKSISELQGLRDRYGDAYGAADEVIRQLDASGLRHPFLRLIRYNIKGSSYDFQAVVYAIVLLAFGETPVWESPDVGADEADPDTRAAMERALGLVRAVQDRLDEVGPLVEEPVDVPGLFDRLLTAKVLPITTLSDVPKTASMEELNEARDFSRTIVQDLGAIATALERLVGRGAFGLGVFAVIERSESDASMLSLIILFIVRVTRALTPEERQNAWDVREALAEVAPKAREVIALKIQKEG
jgi:hypothetical protein